MFSASDLRESLHYMKDYGLNVDVNDVSFDMKTLKSNRDAFVKRLNGIYERNLNNSGVMHFNEKATFVGPHCVRLADGRELKVGDDVRKQFCPFYPLSS